MTDGVTASSPTLVIQAPMTANSFLAAAIKGIDEKLGDGHARLHPELIAAHMNTAVLDYGSSILSRALESALARP
jgi:hypothetical protein